MKVNIIAIGKVKNKSPEQEIINEYIKRCSWKVSITELEEKKNLPVDELKIQEGRLLLSKVSNGSKIIVLDERGQNISSPNLSEMFKKWQLCGASEVAILIGGANGHSDEVRKKADLLLSFGKLTMPHKLIRAVLTEQIYRVESILANHPYHKI